MLDQWVNERYSDALNELQGAIAPGRLFRRNITVQRDDAELFESDFEDDAIGPVQIVMDNLLKTHTFQRTTRTRQCSMGNAADEDIATEDCVWAPRYVVKFADFGERSKTRLIGHVEFLAGHSGALSIAYDLRESAKWGSLRCVLGTTISLIDRTPSDLLQATLYSGCS